MLHLFLSSDGNLQNPPVFALHGVVFCSHWADASRLDDSMSELLGQPSPVLGAHWLGMRSRNCEVVILHAVLPFIAFLQESLDSHGGTRSVRNAGSDVCFRHCLYPAEQVLGLPC